MKSGEKFIYGRKFYEEEYHTKEYELDKKNFDEVMDVWNGRIHRTRFMEMLEKSGMDLNGKTCMEVGFHHGKTIWWAFEKFPQIKEFYGIDFSLVAW